MSPATKSKKSPAPKSPALKRTGAAKGKPAAIAKPESKTRSPARARLGKAAGAPAPMVDFMAQAVAMELEAAQRYEEFADAMEAHNNREVAALFRKMAAIESRHADDLMSEMGWSELPLAPRVAFEGFEGAETASVDAVHYLMQPYHALELALANEERAVRFFAHLAKIATDASVRRAAEAMGEEEREHVALVRAWMKKVDQPAGGWANDPDPPRSTD